MTTTTAKGFPIPEAIDRVADGWEAISDLGDAVDTYLTEFTADTGWVTGGFTMGSGWTNAGSRYRIVGKVCQLDYRITRSGSDLGSPSTGNMSNNTAATAPAAARPDTTIQASWTTGETNGGGQVQSDGDLVLMSMNPTSSVVSGTDLLCSAVFLLP